MGIREMMYNALKGAGIQVHLPGQHEGICKAPYIVIGDGGVVATGKCTGKRFFLVTGYVPANKPLTLRPLLSTAMTALSSVQNVRTSGEITPEYMDEDIKSIYATIEYVALCAI